MVDRILKLIETREAKKIIARERITPVNIAVKMLKVSLLAMCFSTEVSHVTRELSEKDSLRSFIRMRAVPGVKEVYRFLSRFTSDQFVEMVLKLLNRLCGSRKEGATMIVGGYDRFAAEPQLVQEELREGRAGGERV